jgi:hypothetical protein
MIFCARATRGLRRPSLDARSGRSISPHPCERYRASALLARGTRTIRMCSRGTRARLGALGVGWVRMLRAVKGSLGPSPSGKVGEIGRTSPGLMVGLDVPVGG